MGKVPAAVYVLPLLLTAILAMTRTASVMADVGVAIDIGRVTVTERLAKGGTYQLPVIGVRNPGNEPSTYRMVVGHMTGQSGRQPPDSWFTFSPAQFALEAGATQPIRITLDIPTNASPDDYAALLQAQIAPAGEGAQVGAAAASQLTFTVEPSTLLEAWLLRGRTAIEEHAPWSYLLPAFVLLVVGASWLRQRFRVGLSIERRR